MQSEMKKIVRSRGGQALVELTLLFPLLLLMVYGVIEVSQILSTYLTLAHLTREGANLIARDPIAQADGIPTDSVNAVITGAAPVIRLGDNDSQWKVIYSKIEEDKNQACPPKPCAYIVKKQAPWGSYAQTSKIGAEGQSVQISGLENIEAGQTFYAVEVFYDYTPNVMTFVGSALNKQFYDRTIFTQG